MAHWYDTTIYAILSRGRGDVADPWRVVWFEGQDNHEPGTYNVFGLCNTWRSRFTNLEFFVFETADDSLLDNLVEEEPDRDCFWSS
jgi:hypothetical protein